MIKASELDNCSIHIIGSKYPYFQAHFGCEPLTATAQTQKKMRKWLKEWLGQIKNEFPQEVTDFLLSEPSDSTVISFIKECHELAEKQKKELEAAAANMPDDVRTEFLNCLQPDFGIGLSRHSNDFKIMLSDSYGFRRVLLLKNASCSSYDSEKHVLDYGYTICKDDNYHISGKMRNLDDDSRIPFELTFSSAEISASIYNCTDCLSHCETAWEYLSALASCITEKADFSEDYCNNTELELLPLLKEVAFIDFALPSYQSENFFPSLKKHAEKFGCNKAISLLSELENEKIGSKKYQHINKKIISELCKQSSEMMMRDLFERISKSQKEYPHKAHALSPELINEARAAIQEQLEQHGYLGTYPNFVKDGLTEGIRVANSYDTVHFIGKNKEAAFVIHCCEMQYDEHPFVDILCGTALLDKDEEVEDIYSCLFDCNGKRFIGAVYYDFPSAETVDTGYTPESIEQCIDIAAKKAEQIPLSKAERRYSPSVFGLFISVFLLMGGMFAIFMTVGFIAIEFIITLLLGQIGWFPELFMDTPWLLIFISCWILFGGAMGILTVVSKK